MSTANMTPAERSALAQQVRREEKLAKAGLKLRSAELLAQMEQQLAARFAEDDARWKEITEAAHAFVEQCDQKIAALCSEMGVPEQFRPSLNLYWSYRGENARQERRAELRKVGQTRIAALEKEAAVAVEKWSVETQRVLLAGGLKSEEARAFLESLPRAEDLMPPLQVEELEAAVPLLKERTRY